MYIASQYVIADNDGNPWYFGEPVAGDHKCLVTGTPLPWHKRPEELTPGEYTLMRFHDMPGVFKVERKKED